MRRNEIFRCLFLPEPVALELFLFIDESVEMTRSFCSRVNISSEIIRDLSSY